MSKPALSSRSVFLLVLGASLAVAMLPVLWPQLDIAVAAYFLQDAPPINPAQWKWVELVNEYTPDLFRSLALLFIGVSRAAGGVSSVLNMSQLLRHVSDAYRGRVFSTIESLAYLSAG